MIHQKLIGTESSRFEPLEVECNEGRIVFGSVLDSIESSPGAEPDGMDPAYQPMEKCHQS